MNSIELLGIKKTYIKQEMPAVTDINLSIERGSIVTLLGPSGCGKTTLLRLIAGFERAESGEIKLAGETVASAHRWWPPEKRNVGMVFQDHALFPHLNVEKNVGFAYKKPDRRSRIAEVIALVGLTGYEKRQPHELSGGQQQRVALARALVRDPEIILFDEPFSSLDAKMRQQMRSELKRILKKARATALIVSHDQDDALAISDQIVVINEGRIEQIGSPRAIYQYPQTCFVAHFVGSSNLLPGTVATDKKTINTAIGNIRPGHWIEQNPGDFVCLSLRPEGLHLASRGPIRGDICELTYAGKMSRIRLDVTTASGQKETLLAQIHSDHGICLGHTVSLDILPEFVSVIPTINQICC